MIDLKNYAPQSPEFKLPKNVSFPRVIFEGAKDMDEIRKHLSGKFIAESVTNAKAVRFLDSYERASIRANYSELMEDEQPKLETQLAEIEAQCKQLTKDAREKLQAVVTQIRDLVYQVKRGEKEVDLPSDTTVKMALCGHYLYYAWIDGRFQLCKVEKIPSWDEQSLFANLETNKQAFLDVLGIDMNEATYEQTSTSSAGGVAISDNCRAIIGRRCAGSCVFETATAASFADGAIHWKSITRPITSTANPS